MPLLLKESAGGLKTTPDTCFDVRHDTTPLRNQWKKLHEEEPEHRPTTSLNRLIGAELSSIVTIGCGGSRGAGSRLATGTSASTVEHPPPPPPYSCLHMGEQLMDGACGDSLRERGRDIWMWTHKHIMTGLKMHAMWTHKHTCSLHILHCLV